MEVKLNSGALFVNKYKEKENQPDYRGEFVDASGKTWELAGWKNTSKNGNPYLSIKAQEPREKGEKESGYPTPPEDKKEFADEIPF